MSDIFLSYARADQARAKPLAAALARQGWSVFWDLTIPPGKTWHEVIEDELVQARCVVVAWSQAALQSRWVREEAEEGLNRNILLPVLLDAARPPLGFRSIQAENLAHWDGGLDAPAFQRLAGAIGDLLGTPANTAAEAKPGHPAATVATRSFRDPLKDGGFGPEMVIVPSGRFRMGDLDGTGDADERPVHPVRFAQAFAIGRFTATFEEYDRFAQVGGRRRPKDFGWGRGNRPVVDVSWEEAGEYARWLSAQTGKPYRLPSEAEWEYAARAGTETAYWWGDEIGVNRANCDGSGSPWSNQQTAPVGSFPANPWGLHDTVGNVWEWVQDRWHGNYEGAPADGSAWEQGDGAARVLRGGSWYNNPRRARAACRSHFDPGYRNINLGFRLVCAVPIVGR